MGDPADPTTATTRRLNPFAFPAETDQRFALFAIAAVTWVLNWVRLIGEILTEVVSGGRAAADALGVAACVAGGCDSSGNGVVPQAPGANYPATGAAALGTYHRRSACRPRSSVSQVFQG